MGNQTYLEVLQGASSFLEEAGKEVYAAEYLLLERLGWDKTTWLTRMRKPMPLGEKAQFEADLARFAADEPAQYIIGSCEFYGLRLKVTPATLIPRPETEELVALILAENNEQTALEVLDIGTGTGAIALALKANAPAWHVSASDISPAALAVAETNQAHLGCEVSFYLGDLTAPFAARQFDVIVSNPPYIGREEWVDMDVSVRTHEPEQALFAEAQGLDIYQRLAQELPARLHAQGRIYLEIGYRQGAAVAALFQATLPDYEMTLHHDLNGHERMLAMKPKPL